MKDVIEHLADQFLELETCDLIDLLPEIQKRMENCDHTQDWERSVVCFFLINALRFKDNTKRRCLGVDQQRPPLRVVK